ncbi:MAG: anti-sigma factor [Phycisphaera sp.]|nr:anti-sigma factor [Phycisphaera sp.]
MNCCRDLIEFLADYIEGELPAEEAADFTKHLDACPPCKQYVDSYRQTIVACRKACCDEAEKPPKAPEALIAAILMARKKSCDRKDKSDCCE